MAKRKHVRGDVGITRFQALCFKLRGMGWMELDDLAASVCVKERTIRKYCKALRVEIICGKEDFNRHLIEV